MGLVRHLSSHRWRLEERRRVEAGKLHGQVSHGSHHTFPWSWCSPEGAAEAPDTDTSSSAHPLPHLRRRTGDHHQITFTPASLSLYCLLIHWMSEWLTNWLIVSFVSHSVKPTNQSMQCIFVTDVLLWHREFDLAYPKLSNQSLILILQTRKTTNYFW